MDMVEKVSMNLPRELLDEAVQASGAANKTQAVILGLKELIHRRNVEKLWQLRGKGAIRLTPAELKQMRAR